MAGHSDAGVKLGIEGEREFKKGLKDINDTMKVLGSEMTLVASKFDKQDKSVQALNARNSVLNRKISEQKNKIDLLQKALANATLSFRPCLSSGRRLSRRFCRRGRSSGPSAVSC